MRDKKHAVATKSPVPVKRKKKPVGNPIERSFARLGLSTPQKRTYFLQFCNEEREVQQEQYIVRFTSSAL